VINDVIPVGESNDDADVEFDKRLFLELVFIFISELSVNRRDSSLTVLSSVVISEAI
jgi:hypothetical protein